MGERQHEQAPPAALAGILERGPELNSIGAERLLGAGDMLFMPPGTAKLRRLHGPFVSEAEIRKLCDFLRAQGSPDYQMEILETSATGGDDSSLGGDQRDELYDEALRMVLDSGQASISMIQRRLRIGYNRSARMVEQMEREGCVKKTRKRCPVSEMKVGPSEPSCRGRLQTAMSCFGQEPWL